MSGLNIIGKDLMGKSFNLTSPMIKLNELKTENEKGIQEGYQFMTMGLMGNSKNISHGDKNQKGPEESYEMLIFINWLFRMLAN